MPSNPDHQTTTDLSTSQSEPLVGEGKPTPRLQYQRLFSEQESHTLLSSIKESHKLVSNWRTTRANGRTGCRVDEALFLDKFQPTPAERERLLLSRHLLGVLKGYMSAFARVPFDYLDPIEIIRYEAGSQYPLHTDLAWRPCTGLLYLNADYSGGQTQFPDYPGLTEPYTIRPLPGFLLTWDNSNPKTLESYKETWHRVLPVLTGVKYVLICWTLRNPYDPTDGKSGTRPKKP